MEIEKIITGTLEQKECLFHKSFTLSVRYTEVIDLDKRKWRVFIRVPEDKEIIEKVKKARSWKKLIEIDREYGEIDEEYEKQQIQMFLKHKFDELKNRYQKTQMIDFINQLGTKLKS